MTDINTAPTAGDNIEKALAELRNKMRKFGRDEAAGTASRPAAAVALVSAAYDGDIDEDNAESLYIDYASGVAMRANDNPLVSSVSADPQHKSAKQQISKFRQFIKCGMLPAVDARDVIDRGVHISKAMESAGVSTYSRFDAMLNVARAQIAQPDTPLTDEQIEQAVCRPDKAEKSDLDKLIAAYKAAYKLAADLPLPGTQAAVEGYADAITEAGGDLPPMTKEEKAAAKEEAAAMAFLAKRGMVTVNALPAE